MKNTKLKTASLLFALCGLFAQQLNAQFEYRQYLYPSSSAGSPDFYQLSSVVLGDRHSFGGPAPGGYHVIGTSATSPVSASNFNFEIRITNAYGDYISANPWDLFNSYQVYLDPNGCGGPTPLIVPDTYGMSVIETGNPSSTGGPSDPFYAVVATVGNANRTGCVFTLLHSEGAPIASPNNYVFYQFPLGATNPSKPYITESSAPGNYYICGSYNLGGQDEMYVLKVPGNSGGINPPTWQKVYTSGSVLRPAGILESPHNSNDLVIVGTNVQTNNNRRDDGFFMKLDVGTGNVLTFKVYGNTGAVLDQFTSFAPAFSNSVPRPKGYVIGGKTLGTVGYTSWMLKVDQNGVIGWNRALQGSAGTNQEISGVLERASINNVFDYFGATGTGAADITVFKLDNNGSPNFTGTGSNEFMYNYSLFNGGGPAYITCINSGSPYADGLNVFGSDLINNNVYAIKAYFSGESGCNENITNLTMDMSGPNSVLTPVYNSSPPLQVCSDVQIVTKQRVAPNPLPPAFQGIVLCNNSSLPLPATNARTSAVTGIDEASLNEAGFQVYPNPATDNINVSYNVSMQSQVNIDLYNYMGQQVRSLKTMDASPGSYKEDISLSSLNLSAGVYFIKAEIGTRSYTQKIVYTK